MGKDARIRRARKAGLKVVSERASVDLGVEPGTVKVAMWGGAFLDLMGYRRQLVATDLFPPLEDRDEAIEIFKEVVARRNALLEVPRKFLLGAAEVHRAFKDLPPEAVPLQKHLSNVRVATTGFADNVVLETPLDTIEKAPLVSLWELVVASAVTLFQHLSVGSPLRGGIEVGYGMYAYGQLHSGATVKAVNLEKCAGYPRILVGDRFRAYLDNESRAPDIPGPARIHRTIAPALQRIH